MKKLLFPFLALILLSSCKKQISKEKLQEEIINAAANGVSGKITICHHDPETGNNITISISANAWPAHQAHGDLRGDCSSDIITICGKDWMLKNLDVSTYRNGDIIPQVTNSTDWFALTTGAWCWYANNSTNGTIYGKLYNWYTVQDPRGLAPVGWHVPSDVELTELSNCLGGAAVAGGAMKETGTVHWTSPNSGATNSSGFTALPSGARIASGTFINLGNNAPRWSSTESDANNAWLYNLSYNSSVLTRGAGTKRNGFSVRCIRN